MDLRKNPAIQHLITLVTCPSLDEARSLSRHLLQEKLAACINLMPVQSLYTWEGEFKEDHEFLMIIKTTDKKTEQLASAIKQRHTYSLPEMISVAITDGSSEYLNWITQETQS